MERYFEKFLLNDMQQSQRLLGPNDDYIKQIEQSLDVSIVVRGETLTLYAPTQETLSAGCRVMNHLLDLSKRRELNKMDIGYSLTLIGRQKEEYLTEKLSETLLTTAKGKHIRAKTLGQYHYIKAIREKDITFGIGPAGTGKTYLAVVMAVRALRNKQVERIILTRPAVEAGEKLGFLPGDLQEKVDPYLRPLYDGLYDTLGADVAQKYMEKGIIEVAPLAYMRGRTLDDAFIILDEAQNTTPEQMKMFLTRIGFGSKAVVTGDVTQIDLPKNNLSGLILIEKILSGIEEISFNYLSAQDVVRHPVVAKIIAAYDDYHKGERGVLNDGNKR